MKFLLFIFGLLSACASKPKEEIVRFSSLKAELDSSFHSAKSFGYSGIQCTGFIEGIPDSTFWVSLNKFTHKHQLIGKYFKELNAIQKQSQEDRIGSLTLALHDYTDLPSSIFFVRDDLATVNYTQKEKVISANDGSDPYLLKIKINPGSHSIETIHEGPINLGRDIYQYKKVSDIFLIHRAEKLGTFNPYYYVFSFNDSKPLPTIESITHFYFANIEAPVTYRMINCELLKK